MTGVDRVDSNDVFESTGRVEILDEVNEEEECGAEEASEFRERLDGRPELHSL